MFEVVGVGKHLNGVEAEIRVLLTDTDISVCDAYVENVKSGSITLDIYGCDPSVDGHVVVREVE
tara:strand:+ start:219 stop:410 length:192 start_codon:yes stop_codon:yes gene_type:complete